MLKSTLFASIALALIAAPANAAVPKISGKYIVADSGTCQAIQDGSNPGLILSLIETANFDPATGMVKLTGVGVGGDLVVWSGGTAGYQTQTLSKTHSYSNTATTLTVNGNTLNIIYGAVKNGIAQSAVINGVDGNGCVSTVTAIHE